MRASVYCLKFLSIMPCWSKVFLFAEQNVRKLSWTLPGTGSVGMGLIKTFQLEKVLLHFSFRDK